MFGACKVLRWRTRCDTSPRVANTLTQLPDDPALLKQIIVRECAARDAVIVQIKREVVEREQMLEQVKREAIDRIEAMQLQHKAEMNAILRRFYGPRSEKFDPTELLLFGEAMTDTVPVDPAVVVAEVGETLLTRRIAPRHKHGRQKLPAHLPRFEVIHDLSDARKNCPCCDYPRSCIGSDDNEQLEFIQASFKVIVHKRLKYACATCSKDCPRCDCKSNINIADKPDQPIDKGLPGPGLLAHIILSKLGDHLPLYRLENIFERAGVDIARSTMCAWMLACGELVKPLVELMTTRVKQSKVIHTDDTTVKVQDASRKGTCRTGRVWCYLGDEDNPYDIFDFSPDRKREHPQKFLDDFAGYLNADAYGGYDGIYTKGNVHEVACWAHARRKFFDAKETDAKRAARMLRFVGRLYAIERAIKLRIEKRLKNQLDPKSNEPAFTREQQHAFTQLIRQKRSTRMLAKIKAWLDAEKQLILPRSKMGEAFTYALNQWQALTRYTEQGYLNIDNNAAERALKRVAIGRKNWLFAGSDEAGKNHARLWTLIASAQRHGLDPQKYLTSILARINQTQLSDLHQFLPEKWNTNTQSPINPPITESPTAETK